ncbi:hypothetical protein BDB01DRAFT_751070 [Pilobolus umbonatus]|nr:hypothetical protein BDB01DRAFT_751070 [Pilobolus umbonatus]
MDIKEILSLLNQQIAQPIVPTGLDITNISPDLIKEVRQEYLATQQKDDISTATSITPEVLLYVGKLAKETNVIDVLRQCKIRQDRKEAELFQHRQSIKARYNKQRESIQAKELIGIYDPQALQSLERELARELRKMDIQIVKDMDKEVRYLQQEMSKLKVPFFKVTNEPNEISLQLKILSLLQDMI